MSLEFVKEAIKVNQVVGEDSVQTVIENDIIVPDIKPDIARVILMDGEAFAVETEAVSDKVIVNGAILFKILYIPDEENPCVKSINTNANFSYGVDMTNVKPGMRCYAKCDIEHIEHTVLNGRKINVKTIIKITSKVFDEVEKDFVNDLMGVDNIQVLKDNVSVNTYLGSNKINYIVREDLDIPAGKPSIREILRNDVKITGKDFRVADNRILVKGDLNIATLYVGDDESRSIQYMEHEIPFNQFIDLQDINEQSMCSVDYQVVDSRFEAVEDSDGELRVLSGEVSINIFAEGYNKKTLGLITDAYSPLSRMEIEKQPFKVEDVAAQSKSQINIKDIISVQDGNPEITEVFNVLCKPVISEYQLYEDKIVVEGIVSGNVLYLANSAEQPVFCYKQEIPFKHTMDIDGIKPEMGCNLSLDIEHCNYSMISSNEVEIRLILCIETKCVKQVALPLITKVSELPAEDKKPYSQPSIIIYFSQPGDNLWKVAKKYLTTVADIQRVNELENVDALTPGMQIIIPKRN